MKFIPVVAFVGRLVKKWNSEHRSSLTYLVGRYVYMLGGWGGNWDELLYCTWMVQSGAISLSGAKTVARSSP